VTSKSFNGLSGLAIAVLLEISYRDFSDSHTSI
jgi:hypothetical protein